MPRLCYAQCVIIRWIGSFRRYILYVHVIIPPVARLDILMAGAAASEATAEKSPPGIFFLLECVYIGIYSWNTVRMQIAVVYVYMTGRERVRGDKLPNGECEESLVFKLRGIFDAISATR